MLCQIQGAYTNDNIGLPQLDLGNHAERLIAGLRRRNFLTTSCDLFVGVKFEE